MQRAVYVCNQRRDRLPLVLLFPAIFQRQVPRTSLLQWTPHKKAGIVRVLGYGKHRALYNPSNPQRLVRYTAFLQFWENAPLSILYHITTASEWLSTQHDSQLRPG
jgi:hypothetical protein